MATANAPVSAPSPHAMQAAMASLRRTLADLLAADSTMADDEDLLADCLEGEADDDALRVLDRMVRATLHADDMAAAAKARAAEIVARQRRFERRSEAYRATVQSALECLGRRKYELPDVTVTMASGRASVVITDEALLPERFVRVETTRTPDKKALAEALKGVDPVPGAVLSNSRPTLTMRRA